MQSSGRGCARCGERLPVGGRGRIPTYCSTRCRVAAHRARNAAPKALRDRARWVRRSAKKVPLQTSYRVASSTDPATWTTYARAKRSKAGVGLGFVLNGDGIVCVDLDHCVEDGKVASWAREILDRMPSTYVEVSPSGTGLHVFGLGDVPVGRKVRRPDGARIEVYGTGRFIAVTGSRFEGAPSRLADLSEVLANLI